MARYRGFVMHALRLALFIGGLGTSTCVMAATEFQAESQTLWVTRTEAMARIAGDGTAQVEGDAILANMKSACDGLQGEQMGHEYGRVPRWALSSQVYACSAFDRWSSGDGFFRTKVPCLDVQRGIDALGQMKASDEAPEVVTAATNLKTTLQALLESAKKSGSLRCRY